MPTITNYDLSGFTNSNNTPITNIIATGSQATNYLPGILLVIGIYFIIFLALKMKGTPTPGTFAASNTVLLLLCLLMYPLGAIPGLLLIVSIILLPMSIFLIFVVGNSPY
jgi:membrane-bound ClpP family serine protease